MSLKKYKSQGEAVEVTVNSKKEERFLSVFYPRIRPLKGNRLFQISNYRFCVRDARSTLSAAVQPRETGIIQNIFFWN